MRKWLLRGFVLVALVLPWALVLLVRPVEPVPEWCEMPYRVNNEGATRGEIEATLRTRFKSDGTGYSTLSGTVTVGDKKYRLNRLSENIWHRQGDFMLVNTSNVRSMADDTLPAALAEQILFTSMRNGSTDYYQMYQIPNGDQIINFSGMPRLYCHT